MNAWFQKKENYNLKKQVLFNNNTSINKINFMLTVKIN